MANCNFRLAVITLTFLVVSETVAMAQPYTLTTGGGPGDVTVGVDGYGTFGKNGTLPDSADATYNTIPPPASVAVPSTMFESGLALRIGGVGPMTFLTSGTIGGSGGLPKVPVGGTTTTGTSNFVNSGLSFNLVQTIAPMFNGAARTGTILTQTYTITNPTAAPITFELARYVDTQGVVYTGGQFFSANGIEVLWSDAAAGPNGVTFGITGIGGTPLQNSRFEIKNFPTVRADILAGNPFNDAVAPGQPYNVTLGLRNVFTLAAAASTVYTAHSIWCNGPGLPAVIFPTAPAPPAPAPGILYGVSTTTNQLYTITTTPTAGIGAGLLVGPLSTGMQSPGISFRQNNLYAWDQVANRVRQLDPATGSTLATIDIGVAVAGLGGDMAFRSDGIGFLSQGLNFYRFDITVPNNTPLPNTSVPVSGMAFDAANNLIALRPSGSQFYTIDQATGVATPFLGPTGLAGGIGGAIAFDGSGNLYAAVITPALASFLYKIDLATGNASLLGNIGVTQLTGLAFSRSTAGSGGGVGSSGEGTYIGCQGPESGSEGGFGFSRVHPSMNQGSIPTLLGPFWINQRGERTFVAGNLPWNANLTVLNVSQQQVNGDGQALQAASTSVILFALALVSAAALGLVVLARKMSSR